MCVPDLLFQQRKAAVLAQTAAASPSASSPAAAGATQPSTASTIAPVDSPTIEIASGFSPPPAYGRRISMLNGTEGAAASPAAAAVTVKRASGILPHPIGSASGQHQGATNPGSGAAQSGVVVVHKPKAKEAESASGGSAAAKMIVIELPDADDPPSPPLSARRVSMINSTEGAAASSAAAAVAAKRGSAIATATGGNMLSAVCLYEDDVAATDTATAPVIATSAASAIPQHVAGTLAQTLPPTVSILLDDDGENGDNFTEKAE